jgi:uncharacterized RDD family membrane protein YckC
MSCAACGTENPVEARFCIACGAALDGGAPPAHLVAGQRVARLGDRLFALILDTALLGALFALVGTWAAARWGGLTANGFDVKGAPAGLTLGGVAVFGFLYYWLLEALFGVTIGKAIVGVKVADVAGHACGAKRSLVRNLLRLVDGLGFYLIGFLVAVLSRKRQRLGDHFAGTYVIEKGGGRLWRVPLAFVWLALIGTALWGAYALHGTAPTPQAIPGVAATPASPVATPAPPAEAGVPAAPPTAVLTSGELKLADFAFLKSAEGPARPSGPFKPKERLFASFKATALGSDPQGQVHLRYGVEVLDPNGVLVQTLSKELDGPPGASNAATVSAWFDIPLFVPPGTAKLRVRAHDNVKGSDGEIVASFVIDSPATAISRQLEIRDLRFSASESGAPLEPAAVSAGATIYVAGKLAGMQFREDRIDVGIAFQVLDPQGRTVMDKPDFLSVQDSFVYHPPTFYVPITAHLSLPIDAMKGRYREKYVVTDRIGGATRSYELAFELK